MNEAFKAALPLLAIAELDGSKPIRRRPAQQIAQTLGLSNDECNCTCNTEFPMSPSLAPLPEVGAFYWTDVAPDIVNPRRVEQSSVSV